MNAENISKPNALRETSTPVLDSYCKPLVSSEYKTISLCVQKISPLLEKTDQEYLHTLGQTLANSKKLNGEQIEYSCRIILAKVLKVSKPKAITFALMILRLVVLESTGMETSLKECLRWIEEQLVISNDPSRDEVSLLTSYTAKSMAWLTLANAVSVSFWNDIPEKLLHIVLNDWAFGTQSRVEVRQAAASFSYNCVLMSISPPPSATMGEYELTDDQVSLLCGSLESIVEETDATTQLRRLLVAARILMPKNFEVPVRNVRVLMQDLGFPYMIQSVRRSSTIGNAEDATICKQLAGEMLELLKC